MGKASKKVTVLDSKHGQVVQNPSSLLPQVHSERLEETAHVWPMFSVPELPTDQLLHRWGLLTEVAAPRSHQFDPLWARFVIVEWEQYMVMDRPVATKMQLHHADCGVSATRVGHFEKVHVA